MSRRTLTDSQAQFIANALRVAADTYSLDADACGDAGHASLCAQFRKQRDDARTLADRIESASSVTLEE